MHLMEGRGCPTVLLLCAATLLCEITAYMRETYKSVPKQVWSYFIKYKKKLANTFNI